MSQNVVGQLPPDRLRPALSMRGIAVTLGDNPVLRGVDLDVRRGEVLALVGPNGAGKSTLLGVASGDIDTTAGVVELLGEDVASLNPRRTARLRSVMLQEQRLAFGFTAGEVVEMGRTPWYRRPESERDDIAIEAAMRRTDVMAFAGRRFPTLSGGEKARVSLARVLAQEAPVVLLDEPTAALDIHHQEQVLATARDLARTGASVVVVLHDLSLAAAWADRICLMSDGEIRALGSPREVLVAEVVDEVYQHPLEVIEHAGGLVVVPRRPHLDPTATVPVQEEATPCLG